MKQQTRLAVALGTATLVAGGLLAAVFIGSPRAPEIPIDEVHPMIGNDNRQCLRCHGPDKPQARDINHPLRDDCFSCHVWEQRAPRRTAASR